MDFFSDPESFSDSSSSDEQDDIEIQYGGEACSILSSLKESIGKIDDFLSFERGFSQGDVVCSANDPSGQMGRVVNIDMYVDLENIHGKKVKDVNSRVLQKVRSTSVGDFVVHGPWLGKVDKIIDRVTVLFDDGTKCDFSTMGPEKLFPLHPDFFEDSQYPYYPGQRVKVELSTLSKSARWLCGSKEKQDQGTISAVNAGLVFVDWISCALVGSERPPLPPSLQDPKDLTFLVCRDQWQLGDMCILPSSQSEGMMEQIYFDSSSYDVIKEVRVIVKTKTKVDVLWQDGSHSEGIDSPSLIPINNVDAHDFWPEQFVLEKGASDDPQVLSGWRWGVVRSVDAKERTVRIKWGSLPESQATDLAGKQLEETVSAYELVDHPDFSYSLGEIVLKSGKNQLGCEDGKIHGTHIPTRMEMVEDAGLRAKSCSGEEGVFSSNDHMSSIGVVMGIKDGKVEVKWANGITSKVAPYEVSRMDKYENPSPTPVLIRENIESAQYITENEEGSFIPKEKSQELVDSSGHSLPQVAIGIFTNIFGRLFGSNGFTSLSGTSGITLEEQNDMVSNKEPVLESNNSCNEVPSSMLLEMQNTGEGKSEEPEHVQEQKGFGEFASNCAEAFKQFDMITGDSDHHFVDGAGKGLALSQVKRGWLKKVQQEWCILEKGLPETIHVRAYEERMDLLRAVITGAPGTPYHDGLFFFDIFLPPEYPQEPPVVHYHSGGLRLNPNLYESGKVCLSLLNTWTGTGTEVWNPESSTILQVLLSLQALVLNEKPYFNEAGYDQQMGRAEGEKNSVSYNENAFLLSCKSMLYLIRKPPKHFEVFVEEHFKQRSTNILLACEAYMEGSPVGCVFDDSGEAKHENQHGNSLGFKIMLSKIVPMLVEAFTGLA